jgi:hypothetical protein
MKPIQITTAGCPEVLEYRTVPEVHGETCTLFRGVEMEIERTARHSHNESRQCPIVPLAIGSIRRPLDDVAMSAVRTDDDLIRAAQLGDHDAFAELCRRHTQCARQKILGIVRHREDMRIWEDFVNPPSSPHGSPPLVSTLR